ncbi:MAG: hypothetical protein R3194_03340 [Limnobacter sp.]|nr:hypothetical protein [Limnobacter sp.]
MPSNITNSSANSAKARSNEAAPARATQTQTLSQFKSTLNSLWQKLSSQLTRYTPGIDQTTVFMPKIGSLDLDSDPKVCFFKTGSCNVSVGTYAVRTLTRQAVVMANYPMLPKSEKTALIGTLHQFFKDHDFTFIQGNKVLSDSDKNHLGAPLVRARLSSLVTDTFRPGRLQHLRASPQAASERATSNQAQRAEARTSGSDQSSLPSVQSVSSSAVNSLGRSASQSASHHTFKSKNFQSVGSKEYSFPTMSKVGDSTVPSKFSGLVDAGRSGSASVNPPIPEFIYVPDANSKSK